MKEEYRRKRSFWVWPRYSLMALAAYTPEPWARPTEEPWSTHARHFYSKLEVHSKQELLDLVEAKQAEQ